MRQQPRRRRHWRRGGWGVTLGRRWVPAWVAAAARHSLVCAVLVAAHQQRQHLLQPQLHAGAWLQTCQYAVPHCPHFAASDVMWDGEPHTKRSAQCVQDFARGRCRPQSPCQGQKAVGSWECQVRGYVRRRDGHCVDQRWSDEPRHLRPRAVRCRRGPGLTGAAFGPIIRGGVS